MPHATVLVILDAVRADQVRPETMPFLHGLGRQGITGQLEAPPGFAQHTVLFTGRYPDTSGNFSQFVYDPRRSPFKWVRLLGPAKGLIQPRKAMVPMRKGIAAVTKWRTGAYHSDPAWVPPRLLPSFALAEDSRPVQAPGALGAPSLFDLCRRAGLRFRFLAPPIVGNDDEAVQALVRELRTKPEHDLYVIRLSAADEHGHKHGPHDPAMLKSVLPGLDQKLASLHAALSSQGAGGATWDLFVVGGHGMAPVEREVNVLEALQRVDAAPGKDYLVFVHSTLVAFWYLTEKGRRAVERALPGIPGSHIVTDAERRRRRIPLDRRCGDRLLAAEPGVLFWPDYFHVQDSTLGGMHGYLDQREEGYGVAFLASSPGRTPVRSVGLRPLVDVFPTLCELLRLPTPTTNEGASLLRPAVVPLPPMAQSVVATPLPPLPPGQGPA
jgi:predicted AlkP superfamily pyrophosphatase or phosphodiesterase